ncbi:Uncharacterised protein [Mycobacteroides abscessus subsp. abscessus]|nr:Uncharacterised protein [Mycobacteroides abscessus subsp. abscessus]
MGEFNEAGQLTSNTGKLGDVGQRCALARRIDCLLDVRGKDMVSLPSFSCGDLKSH